MHRRLTRKLSLWRDKSPIPVPSRAGHMHGQLRSRFKFMQLQRVKGGIQAGICSTCTGTAAIDAAALATGSTGI